MSDPSTPGSTERTGGDPPESANTPPEATCVVLPIACSKCRYDLRGLSVAGLCPECGRPVRDSLMRAYPQRWSVAAVKAISDGCRLLAIAVPIGLALPFFMVLEKVFIFVFVGWVIFVVCGVWLATSNPGPHDARLRTARGVCRVATATTVTIALATATAATIALSASMLLLPFWRYPESVYALGVLGLVALQALLSAVSGVARRLGVRTDRWGPLCLVALPVGLALLAVILAAVNGEVLGEFLGALIAVGTLVWSVQLVVVLEGLRARIRSRLGQAG